jgi:uncharacterized protein (TIGR03083 family)
VISADDTQLTELLAAHRRQLTGLLAALSPGAWDQPSLCAGWRVREVAAHILMPLRYPAWRFLAELARDRGNFNRMADRVARRDGAVPPPELVSALREHEHTVWKPPGGGLAAALTHDVIHGLDIAVALGAEHPIAHPIPEESMRVVLAAVTSPRSLKHFGIDITGTRLSASDIDWSYGSGSSGSPGSSGSELSGSAADLALVLCGRTLPAGRLQGAIPA